MIQLSLYSTCSYDYSPWHERLNFPQIFVLDFSFNLYVTFPVRSSVCIRRSRLNYITVPYAGRMLSISYDMPLLIFLLVKLSDNKTPKRELIPDKKSGSIGRRSTRKRMGDSFRSVRKSVGNLFSCTSSRTQDE